MATGNHQQTSNRIRVAIVDDHPLFREGVVASLSNVPIIEVVGQGGDAEQAIQISQDLLPDVLLLDISLPGGGIEAMREIARLCPFIKVIMLTASENEHHVSAALESGARGYILKGIGAADLVRTIQSRAERRELCDAATCGAAACDDAQAGSVAGRGRRSSRADEARRTDLGQRG